MDDLMSLEDIKIFEYLSWSQSDRMSMNKIVATARAAHELKAENESLAQSVRDANDVCNQYEKEKKELKAEIESLRKDAETLRKIRKIRKGKVGFPCACEVDEEGNAILSCAEHAEVRNERDALKTENESLRDELHEMNAQLNQSINDFSGQVEIVNQLQKQLHAERSRCDALRYQIYCAMPWGANLGEVSDEEFIGKVKEQVRAARRPDPLTIPRKSPGHNPKG